MKQLFLDSARHMSHLKIRHGTDSAVETEAAYLPPLVIPKGSEGKMETIIFLPEYIDAPMKKGQVCRYNRVLCRRNTVI